VTLMHEQDTGSNPDEMPHIARATFGDVFAVGEFRVLWLSQLLSVIGDQLARVALTLLVYGRTHSALLAAVTFAASVLPIFLGGVTLAGVADRLPRRRVMIMCDVLRCAGVFAMTVPGMPLAALVALLFTVTMISTLFSSARAAVYPEILSGDRYLLGNAVTLTTNQLAQVVGFAAGGLIVGFVGVRTSLLADAATFAASALLIRIWVHARPASGPPQKGRPSRLADLLKGARLVFTRPALRTPMLLGWLAAFYNAPEGIAAPLSRSAHSGTAAVGLILAAAALGASAGAVAFSRLVRPSARVSWMRPLAVASCAVLILFALQPSLPLTLAILFCSGVFDCFQVAASAAFITTAPDAHRSQAFGLAQAGMSLGQGTAMILAGAAAEHFAPAEVVAVAGALGAVTAVVIAVTGAPRQKRAPLGHAPG
jgi:MFS family permease